MTRKQLIEKLRPVLLRRRDALCRSLDGQLNVFETQPDPGVGDMADAAVEDDYRSIHANLAETESRELAKIRDALDRMQAGTYGLCERCGREIPRTRLEALPYATMCVRCQRETEKREPPIGSTAAPGRHRMSEFLEEEDDPEVSYRVERTDPVA